MKSGEEPQSGDEVEILLIDRFEAFFFDLDGVIYVGEEVVSGAPKILNEIRASGCPVRFLTNDPVLHRAAYRDRLRRLGIDAALEEIFNVGYATALWMKRHFSPGTVVHVLGSEGLRKEMVDGGFQLNEAGADDARSDGRELRKRRPNSAQVTPEAVVVGSDFDISYRDIQQATLHVAHGARFIATNADKTFPTPAGPVPGTGLIVSAVRTAAAREPVMIGKPARPIFELALASLPGYPETLKPEQILMIGDNPDTDIAGAQAEGLATAWLEQEASGYGLDEREVGEIAPDFVITRLPELLEEVPGYRPEPAHDRVPDTVHDGGEDEGYDGGEDEAQEGTRGKARAEAQGEAQEGARGKARDEARDGAGASAIRPGVAALIENEAGEVLLVQRADSGRWALPTGRVEIGESLKDAVTREVGEETNLEIRVGDLIAVYSDPETQIYRDPDGVAVQFVTALFRCRPQDDAVEPAPVEDDVLQTAYVDPDSLPDPFFDVHRTWIDDALEGARGLVR